MFDIEERDKYQSDTPEYSMFGGGKSQPGFQAEEPIPFPVSAGGTLPATSVFLAPAQQAEPSLNTSSGAYLAPSRAAGPSYRERVAAYYAGQNPYQVHDERQSRQQLMQLQRQAAERQAAQAGLDALQQATKIPAGNLRKAYLDTISKQYQKLTGSDDTGLFDLYKKASDEEAATLTAGLQRYFEDNPELGVRDVAGLISQPDLLKTIIGHGAERLKLAQAKAQGDAAMALLGGSQPSQLAPGATQGIPESPGSTQPQAPAPGQLQPATVPQAQAPLKGNAALKNQMQQLIYNEAIKQGFPPHVALGVAHAESAFNPNALGGVGEQGLFQLRLGTARELGYTGDAAGLKDPATNARLGIAYLVKNRNHFGGDVDRAVAAHNTGPGRQAVGKPIPNTQYHSSVMKYSEQYKGYQGKPSTPAVTTGATDADAQFLQQAKTELDGLNNRIRLGGVLVAGGNKAAEGAVTALKDQRDTLQKRIKEVEDRYDKTKFTPEFQAAAEQLFPGVPIVNLSKQQREQIAAVAPTMAAQKKANEAKVIAEAELPSRLQTAAAGNNSRFISADEAKSYRNTTQTGPRHPGGMTREQFAKEQAESPGKWVLVSPLATEDDKRMKENLSAIRSTDRILGLIEKNPDAAKLIGHFLSNPAATVQVAISKLFGTDKATMLKYRELAAEISDVVSKIKKARLGGNQTLQELAGVEPLFADLKDADAGTVKTKLRVLRDNIADDFNTELSGHNARGRDTDPNWTTFPLLRDAQTTPNAPTSTPEVPAQPSGNSLIDFYNSLPSAREKIK